GLSVASLRAIEHSEVVQRDADGRVIRTELALCEVQRAVCDRCAFRVFPGPEKLEGLGIQSVKVVAALRRCRHCPKGCRTRDQDDQCRVQRVPAQHQYLPPTNEENAYSLQDRHDYGKASKSLASTEADTLSSETDGSPGTRQASSVMQ